MSEQNNKLSDIELRKLQMVLLDMLIELDRICRKCGIEYSLIGGTLLGAVRHSGFIPWDDDVDVGMTRKNYTAFRKACKTELNQSKYFFQDNTTDPYYCWGYGRIRRKNSEFIRSGQEHMKMKTGIFLDIFPVDGVPDFKPLRYLQKFCCFCIRKILYSESGKISAKTAFLRSWYKLINKIPVRFAFYCLDKLISIHLNIKSELVCCYTFPVPKGQFGHPLRYYNEFVYINFEKHEFPVFKEYKKYLTYKYGDYMTLPPPEKRHWHPAAKIVLPKE